MYKRILLATDGSTLSKKAHKAALALAQLSGAELLALKVVPRYPMAYFEGAMPIDSNIVSEVENKWQADAQKLLDDVTASAQAKGVKAKALIVKSDLVADAVVNAAKKHKCDLIVMASHGRKGIKRLLLGSETQHVLTHSHVPVLVLR
jgi:nucleotide-binding universal stress UspA family protein